MLDTQPGPICRRTAELLPLLCGDDLPEASARSARAHLLDCALCRREYGALVRARQALVDLRPPRDGRGGGPIAAWEQELAARLAAEPPPGSAAPRTRRRVRAAAAALAIVSLAAVATSRWLGTAGGGASAPVAVRGEGLRRVGFPADLQGLAGRGPSEDELRPIDPADEVLWELAGERVLGSVVVEARGRR